MNTHLLLDIIREIEVAKNEEHNGFWYCSDATWVEAGECFIAKYGE